MSELLEKPFMKLREIYPFAYINDVKLYLILVIIFYPLIIISYIYYSMFLFNPPNQNTINYIVWLFCSISIIVYHVMLFQPLIFLYIRNVEPIIIFKNGIIPHTTCKFNKKWEKEFIHFDRIKKLIDLNLGKSKIEFKIILNNNKSKYQVANSIDEYFFIKRILNDYKQHNSKISNGYYYLHDEI